MENGLYSLNVLDVIDIIIIKELAKSKIWRLIDGIMIL